MAHDAEIVLVTPVWNDSERLGQFAPQLVEALQASGLSLVWVIADDGSSAEEKIQLQGLADALKASDAPIELIHFEARSCKGGAIYQAWDQFYEADWLAFVDADGAVSAESMLDLIRVAMSRGKDGGAIGVRHHSEATPVQRGLWRRASSCLFRSLVRVLVGLNGEDTQCGAKVIPGRIYRRFVGQVREQGFIFDVELLILLDVYGADVAECPIPWEERDGSKVRPGRDAWAMLAGLLRIRQRLRAGDYLPR